MGIKSENAETMNVCLLSRYFDLRNGGIGRFSEELYSGLQKKGVHKAISGYFTVK